MKCCALSFGAGGMLPDSLSKASFSLCCAIGKHSKADKKDEKHQVSHASAMRRDLARAFGLDEYKIEEIKRKDGCKLMVHHWVPKRKPTPREKVLLDGDANTLPVDFHSWRRAYCQSLADAGVNSQLAKALAGHSTEAAHEKYLRSSERARELPEAARPQIDLSKAQRPSKRVVATSRSKT